jgi:lipid A disaccharide synthetase
MPHDRIERVGNLAIDGALLEAQSPAEPGAPVDGVLFMPGSRRFEVEQMIPFFFTCALRMHRERPALPIAFGISPFTQLSAVRAAVEAGGDPMVFAQRGSLEEDANGAYLVSSDRGVRFPIVRRALAAARVAKLTVTIPGTKAIELAALGKPAISCSPANKPEGVTINGPLTYLDRIPLIGVPAKRAIVVAYSKRFKFHTQPNMDAGSMLIHELHGTLTPGRVARVALARLADEAWLQQSAQALGALYREHAGAASRMAAGILALDRGV